MALRHDPYKKQGCLFMLRLSVKFYSVGEFFPETIKEESLPLSGNVIISVHK